MYSIKNSFGSYVKISFEQSISEVRRGTVVSTFYFREAMQLKEATGKSFLEKKFNGWTTFVFNWR